MGNISSNSKGMYKGKSHAEGGIPVVVDGNTNVEIEGNEYHLCRDAMSSAKIYSFKNKSNKEILDSIYSSEGCKFVQGIANSGDFIVCKLVVLDDDKRTISGTVKSIIDTMQSEKSCNVSDGSNKMEKGGGIENLNIEKFMQWYKNWYKDIADKMNILISLPSVIAPFKEDNVVILDLFEKIDQNIDAKPYLKDIVDKADEYDVTIYLEPMPRYKFFLKNIEKRIKISKHYLISYYEKFDFKLTPNKIFMKRLPKDKMEKGGGIKSEWLIDDKEATFEDFKEIYQRQMSEQIFNFNPKKVEYFGSNEQNIRAVEDYKSTATIYNKKGELKQFYMESIIRKAFNDFSLVKFGNAFRKHIDTSFKPKGHELNNMKWSELAGYIIGDSGYYISKEDDFRGFAKQLGIQIPEKQIVENESDNMEKGGAIDEHKETYEKWKSLVNMSKSELKEFYDSQDGKDAGLSDKESNDLGISNGRESARWIMRMKDTPVSDWTPKMWEWANKQISFISRMSGNKGSLYDDKGNKTRKHTSLLIWGHNPKKMGRGGEVQGIKDFKNVKIINDYYPKNIIAYVSPKELLDRHLKDEPSYSILIDKNKIGNRVETAKKYLENYLNNPKLINPKTNQRTEYQATFEPSIVSIYNGKFGFTDGRHRVLSAHLLGLEYVPISIPKNQIDLFRDNFSSFIVSGENGNPVGGVESQFKYSKEFAGITIYTDIEQEYVGENFSPFESKGSFKASVRKGDLVNIAIESKELENFNFQWGVDDWNTIAKKLKSKNINELELFYVGAYVKTYELKPIMSNSEKMGNGGDIKDLILSKKIELNFYRTLPDHALEYGIKAKNPLYLKNFHVTKTERLKGIGKNMLKYLDDYAIENGNDVIFGHINQKATFSKNKETYLNDTQLIKNWLHDNGYAVNDDDNNFHKVVGARMKQGGEVQINILPIKNKKAYDRIRQKQFGDDFGRASTGEFIGKDGRRYYISKTANKDSFYVHDADIYDKEIEQGYAMGNSLIAQAHYDTSSFYNNSEEKYFTGYSENQSILVNDEHKRNGVATAITKFAENIYKAPYRPSSLLSEEMKGFVSTYKSNLIMKQGGNVITYRNKFNKKYGFELNESHSLEEIAKLTSLKLSALQDIYNKGIGAYKTNPESVRPIVKSKEQWAMARVYSAVMGGKASKVDANELERGKMADGGEVGDNLFELVTYQVTIDTNSTSDEEYSGFDEEKAISVFSGLGANDLPTGSINYGGFCSLYKKVDKYKFVYELDKEYNEEISDYPIEEYYDDKKYYKLVEEGEYDIIEHRDIAGANDESNNLLEEITNYYHDEYGKFKYNLINVYADNDIEQDEPIGCIQLRIADHTENINNVDRFGRCDFYISVVVADNDVTRNRFGMSNSFDRRSNEVEILVKSRDTFDDAIDRIQEEIINAIEYVKLNSDDNTMKNGGELAKGIKTEMEHKSTIDKFKRKGISDKEVAKSIAQDHLKEDSSYYSKLAKMEGKMAKGGNIPHSNMELLAPNGNKSNLNHEQWHLVRTPAFKQWFGDWEKLAMAKIKDSAMDEVTLANISKDVSKVVDENGEPLVVYHGSSHGGINVFDISESKRESSGLKEYGNYFTTNKKLADFYHKKGKLEKEEVQNIDREIYKLEQLLYTTKNNRDFDSVMDEIKKLKSIKDGNVYPVFLNLKKIHEFDAKGKEEMSGWRELKVWAGYKWANNRDAMDFLKEGKFEVGKVNGIKAKNIIDAFVQGDKFLSKELLSDVYLVFSANDIKLADGTNTTFDGNNDDIRYEDGGEVSDISKVYSSSSRFKPSETIVFKPPLIGTNGAKLTAYTWAYEMTMKPNYEGELVGKRVSDWTQADSSAETGRDIVHKYTIELPNGDIKVVSSESVPILLGYIDRSQAKVFGNLATASKTLAKQQMKLAIMEAQKKEYDELYSKFEKAQKPTITLAEISDLPPITQYVYKREIEEGKGVSLTYFKMGDVVYNQNNNYNYNEGKYIASTNPNNTTIEQLNLMWIKKRVKEAGGEYPRELYDLKNRVERQKRKVEQMLNPKMGDGGEIEYKDGGNIAPSYTLQTPSKEKSQLTYLQQILVRTKAFKDWFGDWEKAGKNFINDNKNNLLEHYKGISKAINMVTLEPLLTYHGTRFDEEFFVFNVFAKQHARPYAYFAYNEAYSYNFSRGKTMYKCFLLAKNPFMAIGDEYELKREGAEYWINTITETLSWDKYKKIVSDDKKQKLKQVVESQIGDYIRKMYDQQHSFWLLMARDTNSLFKAFLMSHGFTSVFYTEEINTPFDPQNPSQYTRAITIFNANDIKLGDGRNLNFDPMKNDIRYDKGGEIDKEKEDLTIKNEYFYEQNKVLSKKDKLGKLLFGDKYRGN